MRRTWSSSVAALVFVGAQQLPTEFAEPGVCRREGDGQALAALRRLRKLRNSRAVLEDLELLYPATERLETLLRSVYGDEQNQTSDACSSSGSGMLRPGNFHSVKGHAYFVGAISEAHPSFPPQAVQSIVASEWYHPGLTAKAVWCVEDCDQQFSLARRLNDNFDTIRLEVERFWLHPDMDDELKSVGSHTTGFDRLIAGNGTWVDVRLWRGRAFNKHLCQRHFRLICSLVEASPEVWTNPWSHVLLSVLLPGSWVPFHQGHTNGQLTYHLPITLPEDEGSSAELAVLERAGALPEPENAVGAQKLPVLSHPEERTVRWQVGKTLVFDDSFSHAVRYRTSQTEADTSPQAGAPAQPRVVLLMRGWHPELEPEERIALRDFIRRGGEEDPEGYEMMPISASAFGL